MGISTVSKPLTAMTATIQFGGHEVGTLQNVSWDENTNIIRVPAIGSAIDVAHIAGKTEYSLSASRAMLDGDLMVTLMQATINKTAAADIVDLETLKTALQDTGNSLISGVKVANISFDVLIKDLSGNAAFQFEECTMQSKRSRLDANGVIVTEDITMFSRRKVIISSSASTIITDVSAT